MFKSYRVLTIVLVLLSAPAWAGKSDTDFSGTYQVEGVNPDGVGSYGGEATILITGDAYSVEWVIGSDIFYGTGIGYGDILAVGYDGGTALYERQPDGTLSGVWTAFGGQTLGMEILTPISGR